MEILHFEEDLGDTSVGNQCSLGVNLVIDNFCYIASGTSSLHKIWKQSDQYLWRYCILKIWGIQVSFGCERSCSSHRRVSNFNSKVVQLVHVMMLRIYVIIIKYIWNALTDTRVTNSDNLNFGYNKIIV